VLITGITGFVGSHLAKKLVDLDFDVVGIVRDLKPKTVLSYYGYDKKVTLIRGDVTDIELLTRIYADYDIEFVLHLAAEAIVGKAKKSPISTFRTNIIGTASVLEACRINGSVKCIVASTDKVYGYQPERLPYDEKTPLRPINIYDASKASADMIAQVYSKIYNTPVVITRCCNIYGFDLNMSRLIPTVIVSALRNERPVIRSDGTQVREYIYVEDVVNAYLTIMKKFDSLDGKAVNIGSGYIYSVLDAVKIILDLMHKNLEPIVLGEAKDEIKEQYLDSTHFKMLTNWKPRFSFEDGLKITIEEYKKYLGV